MNDTHEPAEVIERCSTPRGEIQLQKRGPYYEIISNGTFLMATYNGESEKLLVREALNRSSQANRVLIGGLGVGYSLEEAVSDPRVEQVTVIEIEQNIIDWNKGVLAPVSNRSAFHSKCSMIQADLHRWLHENDDKFHLICLDIDNGPDWTVYDQNDSLYSSAGLSLLSRHLAPGGCLSFWSATASPEFVTLLKQHFAYVDRVEVPQERGEPDIIFLVKNEAGNSS